MTKFAHDMKEEQLLDVHPQEQLQEKLQEMKRNNVAMFRANPHPAILFDNNHRLVDCNPAAIEYFGFSSHEAFIQGFEEYFNKNIFNLPGRPHSILERLNYVQHNGDCSFFVDTVLNNKVVSFNVAYRLIPWNQGSGVCLYLVDQTKIQEAESKLLRRERLLEAVNAAAAKLFSLEPKDFEGAIRESLKELGKSVKAERVTIWKNYVKDDSTHAARLGMWSSENCSEPIPEDLLLEDILPNWEKIFTYKTTINSLVENLPAALSELSKKYGVRALLLIPILFRGKYWGFIEFSRHKDAQIFSAVEEGLLRSGGTLVASAINRREIATIIIKAKDDAQAGTRAKSEFLSRMSHELRTPMNAIIGMAAIARKSPEKTKYCLEQIDVSSRQLLAIINDILDMSKIEANKLEIEEQEFDFEKMLRHTKDVIRVKMDEKNQRFVQNCNINFNRMVWSDELRLSQVLLNLLSNAVKFTPENGTITLSAAESAGQREDGKTMIHIEIRDTGIGISPEQQARLFNSFEQAETGTTRKYGGTGLGLAICKNIIKLMDGDIWVESESGIGSAFIFEVPVRWGRPLEHQEETLAATEVESMEQRWVGKRILVAEDVDINREIINIMLEETGIIVDNAVNGSEAVDKFTCNPENYDLILMDIQMPEMDGLEAARHIRAFERGLSTEVSESRRKAPTGVPIIAMTANVFTEDVQHCLNAGMNCHIGKPINMETLFATMKAYLG